MTVSYCITLFNKEHYIASVLEAAFAEREATGGEVLLYDDASTDQSLVIAEKIAARAPLRLLRGRRNIGVFAATNILLSGATCSFLRIIDGDDVITRGSTQHLLAVLRQHNAILVHGAAASFDKAVAADFNAFRTVVERDPFREGLRALRYNLSATLISTAAAKAILPLPEELRISQDLCVALRLAKLGKFVATNVVVSLSPFETANRLSRKLAAMYRDTCLIIAMELERGSKPSDAAFAVRRNAARCLKYFRREAPRQLNIADKLFLTRCSLANMAESIETQCSRLRAIARLYARDETRILA